jgi:hypothetical protein
MFMEKESGYDEWFQAKVTESLDRFTNGQTQVTAHDEAMDKIWRQVKAKDRPLSN